MSNSELSGKFVTPTIVGIPCPTTVTVIATSRAFEFPIVHVNSAIATNAELKKEFSVPCPNGPAPRLLRADTRTNCAYQSQNVSSRWLALPLKTWSYKRARRMYEMSSPLLFAQSLFHRGTNRDLSSEVAIVVLEMTARPGTIALNEFVAR